MQNKFFYGGFEAQTPPLLKRDEASPSQTCTARAVLVVRGTPSEVSQNFPDQDRPQTECFLVVPA